MPIQHKVTEKAKTEKAPDSWEMLRATLGEHNIAVLDRAEHRSGEERLALSLGATKQRSPSIYRVERKTALRPHTLGALVSQLKDVEKATGLPVLLLTDYVTPQVAEQLQALKQPFVDGSGNAYLFGPGLYVYVAGRKPTGTAVKTNEAGALTVTGLKIHFALLCDLTLVEQPLREIARAAGVALGAVSAAMDTLQKAGLIRVNGRTRSILATKTVLDHWAYDYARKLRPKTLVARYRTENFAHWKDWSIDSAVAQWGGEPAADLLTHYLTPGILTLYAEKMPPRLIVEQRMHLSDDPNPNGTIELRKPYWGSLRDPLIATKLTATLAEHRTVWTVLVYADLLASGEARNIETAGIVYERYLAGLFPAA
jgi:hypothetical protein